MSSKIAVVYLINYSLHCQFFSDLVCFLNVARAFQIHFHSAFVY